MSNAKIIYITKLQENLITNNACIFIFFVIEYLPIFYHTVLSAFYLSACDPPDYYLNKLKYISLDNVIAEHSGEISNSYFWILAFILFGYFLLYRFFIVKLINNSTFNSITLNFYEFFIFRALSLFIFGVVIKGIFSTSTSSLIVSVVLFSLMAIGVFSHIQSTRIYLNFTKKNYFFNNQLLGRYDNFYFLLKMVFCFIKFTDNLNIKKFLDCIILTINFLCLFQGNYLLLKDKYTFFFNHKALIFKVLGQHFIVILSLSLLFMKKYDNLFFALIIANSFFLSFCSFYLVNYFSFSKIFQKGNILGPLVYIFNLGEDWRLKEEVIYKIINQHKITCNEQNSKKECNFCKIIVSQMSPEYQIISPNDKGNTNAHISKYQLFEETFVNCYFKYLAHKVTFSEKTHHLTFADTSYYYLIKMYLYSFSQNVNFIRVALNYQKVKKLYKASKSKMSSESIKKNFLPNFLLNLGLIYFRVTSSTTKNEAELRKTYFIKMDFIIKEIRLFFKKIEEFFKVDMKSPKDIVGLADIYSGLGKNIDFDYLSSKENRYNYQAIICQYVLETIYNDKIDKNNYIVSTIHSFDEVLTMRYNEDKIILSSLNLLNESLIINQCGRELINYKGSEFQKIFPSFLSNEGLERTLSTLTNPPDFKKKNQLSFYYKKIITDTIESITISFYALPTIENQDENILYVISNYKIERERLLIFEKRNLKLQKDKMVLIGVSESVSKHLHINSKIIQNSLDNFMYIFYDDLISENDLEDDLKKEHQIDFQKIFTKMEKIFKIQRKDFHVSQTKFVLTLKEEINSKYFVFYLEDMSSRTKRMVTAGTEGSLRRERTEFNNQTDIGLNFEPMQTMSSSCLTKSSVSGYINETKELKNEKNYKYKEFYIYVYYILGFNFLILIIIVIFLSIALKNNIELKRDFKIITNFNNFQGYFFHSALSIFSLSCNSDYVEQLNCINQFKIISQEFSDENGLSSNEMMNEYVSREVVIKARYIIETLTSWLQDKQKVATAEFYEITSKDFELYVIKEYDFKVTAELQYMSFGEAVKLYVNILNLLATSEEYLVSPVFIISIDGYNFNDLTNTMLNKQPKNGFFLNDSQRYYYTLLMNFQKYIKTLIKLGDILYNKYNSEIENTRVILLSFICIFLALHLLMLGVVIKFIFKYKDIHKDYYFMIYDKLVDKECLLYFNEKISSMLSILDLYKSNPNLVITQIEKLKKKEIQRKSTELKNKTQQETHTGYVEKPALNEKLIEEKYMELITSRYLLKVVPLFSGYFVICLIIFWIIMLKINQVYSMNEYSKYNYDLSNDVYINFAVTQLMSLTNQTEVDFYSYFDDNNNTLPDPVYKIDNYVKINIQEVLSHSYTLLQMERTHSFFESFDELLDFKCEKIFEDLNDPIMNEVKENYPESDYSKMLSQYCKKFQSLNTYKEDKFSVNVVEYQNARLLNKFIGRDFESLAKINNDDLLYTLYMEILLLIRPIRKFVYNYIQNDVIDKILSGYNILIIIFIIFNFCYDFFILGFLKFKIIQVVVYKSKEIIRVAQSFECF